MEHRQQQVSTELLDTQRALRVVRVTFFALVLTGVVEGAITIISGSTALLADTIHSLSNAFTTLPLWIAFSLARKKPTRQFPYGYHRAEDVAGILIIIFIAVSAALVGYESVRRLVESPEIQRVPWAMAAGAVGFLANEAIAQYRIKVGKDIGSAALIADGHHARVDGLGSLAVVVGLLAVLLGVPIADPVAGLAITALIVYLLLREAGPLVLSRVMDRIDPAILSQIQDTALEVPGVLSADEIRARWVGHRLHAELNIGVDAELSIGEGHRVAEQAQHMMMHSVPKLQQCTIHVEPFAGGEAPAHEIISHHFPAESGHEDTI